MSPFDYTKSLTNTKENLFVDDTVFEKEYVSFMVNRILANSPSTLAFSGAMNSLYNLPKEMQYKFYFYGIPKNKNYTKYIKKEDVDIPAEHLEFICRYMKVSMSRAIEYYGIIGSEAVQKAIDSKGGKMNSK